MLRTVLFRYFSSSEEDFWGKHVDHIFFGILSSTWRNIETFAVTAGWLSEHTSNNHEVVASKGPGTV